MTRTIDIDPDGGHHSSDWLYVVVAHPTGIAYRTQFGGTANLENAVEGFLVPVSTNDPRLLSDDPDLLDPLEELREIFGIDFNGAGVAYGRLTTEQFDRIAKAVGCLRYWGTDGKPPEQLQLDRNRLHELDEAWVPVLTSDGPGVLWWKNSD